MAGAEAKVETLGEATGARTALVTGASAGIGREFAKLFAEREWNVVLVARRRERLEELAREIRVSVPVAARVLASDLADPAAPERIFDALNDDGIVVDALVNDAGYALGRRFTHCPWEEQARLVQVMVTAPAHLCRLFVPGMLERRYGRIVNIGSIAAWAPPSPGSLYGGTKAFLTLFSRSLALELEGSGVHVTAVCPGFTRSEFHDAMGTRESVDGLPGFMWMDAQKVARQGYEAVMRGDAVIVNGLVNRVICTLCKLVPDVLINALRPSMTREGF
jgi:short-subunit dehydrogenase